jgi:hypothetical protein
MGHTHQDSRLQPRSRKRVPYACHKLMSQCHAGHGGRDGALKHFTELLSVACAAAPCPVGGLTSKPGG